MHPNVTRGNLIHAQHFQAIRNNGWLAPGWEVYNVNQQLALSGLRPDWIIVNKEEKRALIIDVTSKYSPTHYKKGLLYVDELEKLLGDPAWEVVYIEDYWLNATVH
jgi:hypothetical protein